MAMWQLFIVNFCALLIRVDATGDSEGEQMRLGYFIAFVVGLVGPRRASSPVVKAYESEEEEATPSISPSLASLMAAAVLGPFSLTFVPYVASVDQDPTN